jgi:RNA recognition motif-containing protein
MTESETEASTTPREPKGPPQACIFVASIGTDTSEEKLSEYFSSFGTVLKVKLLKDKAMRPYAFVQFLVRDFCCFELTEGSGG